MDFLDIWIAQTLAHLMNGLPYPQRVLVVLAEANFTKTLFFSPVLLVLWLRGNPKEKQGVLILCASCAVALAPVWLITSQWVRYKPIHLEHGVPEVAALFAHYFTSKPDYFRWGSFPSDNAAFLGAMSFGLLRLRPKLGWVALLVTVILNGLLRMTVGLHYSSDIVAGASIGWIASFVCFRIAGTAVVEPPLTWVCARIDASPLAKWLVVLFLVEFAVMFHDLRFLDSVVFGAIAPSP